MILEILDPRVPLNERSGPPARVETRNANLVAIIDNSKPRFNVFVDELRASLCTQYEASEGLRYAKPHAAHTAPEAWYDEIARQGGVAIVGWGDCGSCSTCAFLDGANLIARGIPTLVVISDAFRVLVNRLAKSKNLEHVPCMVLPHPPTKLNDEDLKALARARAAEASELLGLAARASAKA